MYPYTTPHIPLNVPDVDFDDVEFFRVCIHSADANFIRYISPSDPAADAETKTVAVDLTQEETAQLWNRSHSDIVDFQIRVKFTNGTVGATNHAKLPIYNIFDEEVI